MKSSGGKLLLYFIGDALVIPLSYVAGFFIRSRLGDIGRFSDKFPVLFLALMTLTYLIIFYFFDLYNVRKNFFRTSSFFRIVLSTALSAIFISFQYYGFFLLPIGRGVFIIANLIIIFCAFIWRVLLHRLFKYLAKTKRLAIVGLGASGREIARVLRNRREEYSIVGYLSSEPALRDNESLPPEIPYLGSPDNITDLIETQKLDEIVVSLEERDSPRIAKEVLKARLKGLRVEDMPELYQTLVKKIPVDFVQEDWFLNQKGFERTNNALLFKTKRFMDVAFSAVILLLSLPFWPLIALSVKLNSKGPVFYSQERIGKNESPFRLYKFRSMIDQAEENGAVWAGENDARITATGKILRKFHLDELPQLVNVLKGDMSLVGPRPERPEFVEELKQSLPYYSFRHFVNPGLTGWAQVNYPYASSLEDSREKLEYDLYYISNIDLLLDIRILLTTLRGGFPKIDNQK